MRSTYECIAVSITDQFHRIGGSQRDDRTYTTSRCSSLDERIIDTLTDLRCVGIAGEQAMQGERTLLFRVSQACTQTGQAMARISEKCTYAIDPGRFFPVLG